MGVFWEGGIVEIYAHPGEAGWLHYVFSPRSGKKNCACQDFEIGLF